MSTVWILVSWDEGMPTVSHWEDGSEAIERLKDLNPITDAAYLYQCNPDGTIIQVEGW